MSQPNNAVSAASQAQKDSALVTSSLAYVNGKQHLGNILRSCLPADVSARYYRGRGCRTILIRSTNILDAMTILQDMEQCQSAEESDDTHYDGVADIYEWLEISFDFIVETITEPRTNCTHQTVQKLTEIDIPRSWTTLQHFPIIEVQDADEVTTTDSSIVEILSGCAQAIGVPVDVWRYHLLSQRQDDGKLEFSWDEFINRNNSILVNNLGNFVYRTLRFVKDRHKSIVPFHFEFKAHNALKADVNNLLEQYLQHLQVGSLQAGLETVMMISARGNRFLEASNLDNARRNSYQSRSHCVVGLAANLVHLLAAIIAPYMPEIAAAINLQLNIDMLKIPDRWNDDSLPRKHQIGEVRHLFSRIHPDKAAEWRAMSNCAEVESSVKRVSAKMAKRELKKNWWKPSQPDLATSEDILPPVLK